MARIRFLNWYQGIAPGTVIEMDDVKQLAILTQKKVLNAEKGEFYQTAERVSDSTPTTAELEQKQAAAAAPPAMTPDKPDKPVITPQAPIAKPLKPSVKA